LNKATDPLMLETTRRVIQNVGIMHKQDGIRSVGN